MRRFILVKKLLMKCGRKDCNSGMVNRQCIDATGLESLLFTIDGSRLTILMLKMPQPGHYHRQVIFFAVFN